MTDVVLRAPERETRTESVEHRTAWEAVLFGRRVLNCAECGDELEPLDAYWDSARTVYCSPEHALHDRA